MEKIKSSFIELAEIFQDNMTLQRDKTIKIWGVSRKKQRIFVLLDDVQIYEGELSEGKFEINLPSQEAAENQMMNIRNYKGEEIVIHNVDIGEVWIAGGQSNMEFPLLCDRDGERVIASANDKHLRYYEVGKYAFEGEREEKLKDDHRWNHWREFIPEKCTHFSAVGTYFAMQLREKLQVPVAVIGCCWGGTSASAWLKEELLRTDKELQVYTNAYDQAVAKMNLEKYIKSDYKKRIFMGQEKNTVGAEITMKNEVTAPLKFPMKQLVKIMLRNQKTGPHDCNRPGGLYQTMLTKIIGYTVKGVIWYQGESDEHQAALYSHLFTKMISCWRQEWNDTLPFLFVQVAPWESWMSQNGKNYPEIRAQQQYVEDHVEGTHMVSIMDIGSRFDIHPKVKEPVGNRLALLALELIYGLTQKYCQAPRISRVEREGKNIVIYFEHAEDGLVAEGNIENLFTITQKGKSIPAAVTVTGNHILLTCNDLSEEKAMIAFAYQPFLTMSLFNHGGLAARPSAPQEI